MFLIFANDQILDIDTIVEARINNLDVNDTPTNYVDGAFKNGEGEGAVDGIMLLQNQIILS